MRVAIQHKLSKAEVRKRLTERTGEIADFIPGGFADVESDWVDDDHMAMGITAMGTFVGADIAVEDQQVVIEVELPKKLAFVKGSIERSIRDNATKMLK
jgi:hypothetical protein